MPYSENSKTIILSCKLRELNRKAHILDQIKSDIFKMEDAENKVNVHDVGMMVLRKLNLIENNSK